MDRQKLLRFGVLLLPLLLYVRAVDAAAQSITAGFAVRDITPTAPLYLPGVPYNRTSTGVQSNLEVRALVLDDGAMRVVLVSLDLIGFFRTDVMRIRAAVKDIFPADEWVIVCSTHTHSSPDTLGIWSDVRLTGSSVNVYIDFVVEQSVAAIRAAWAERTTAQVFVAKGRLRDLIRNDRAPELVDDAVLLVRFQPKNFSPILLVNFAAHPEFLRSGTRISADYVGELRAKFAAKEWGGARAIFFSGALGGMIVANTSHTADREADMRLFADMAIQRLLPLWKKFSRINVSQIILDGKTFPLMLDNPNFTKLVAAGRIPHVLENGTIPIEVSVLSLGPLRLVTIPGECSPEISFRIRALFPGNVVGILGLANDELGYILPSARYSEERHAYERSLAVSHTVGDQIVETLQNLPR